METIYLNTLYEKTLKRVVTVYEIFKEYFGEDRVDSDIPSEKEALEYLNNTPIERFINKPLSWESTKWVETKIKPLSSLEDEDKMFIVKNISTLYAKNQDYYIYTWWPEVKVTNENNRSADIKDLYAKVKVSAEGTMSGLFYLNRATYSYLHMENGYMHSHVSSIPIHNFSEFQHCCTGRGPINGTITSLNRDFDEDIWKLFCLELDKYVHVESIAGTPYHYLERLSLDNRASTSYNRMSTYTRLDGVDPNYTLRNEIDTFIRKVLDDKVLKYRYINGHFEIGMSFVNYMVVISNEFINWYNNYPAKHKYSKDELIQNNILMEGTSDGTKILAKLRNQSPTNIASYNDKYVCTFKGKAIRIKIEDIKENAENISLFLTHTLAMYISTRILKVLNYEYGRPKNEDGTCKKAYII